MGRALGLVTLRHEGQDEILIDRHSGLMVACQQFGGVAGAFRTLRHGTISFANLLLATDLAGKKGIRMRVHNVGIYGSYWNSDGAGSWFPEMFQVSGSPNNVIFAPRGSAVQSIDGGMISSFFIKETGSISTNSGWNAK